VKADPNTVWKLHDRIIGSPDIYKSGHRPTGQSVNYVTCHDGFTLNDLVSFNSKRNDQNQSQNSDGTNANLSWNCGVEGPSTDSEVEQLRIRQIKNFFALTLLSVGTPMLLMGDEVRRTQQGNNNAYCLDNEVSWFDWNLCEANAGLLRFVQELIHLRLHFDQRTGGNDIPLEDYLGSAHIQWHGTTLDQPDWGSHSHSLAVALHNHARNNVRYIAINSYWNPLEFELPPLPGSSSRWIRMIDTSLGSPDDIADVERGSEVKGSTYVVNPRSIVMLHFASPNQSPER
jgi:glycogen operon protein